jgi:hypothetical protein
VILSAQHLAPGGGFFEPQRKFDWSLEIALDDAGDQVIIMQSLDSLTGLKEASDEIELNYAGESRYVAGKTKYSDMDLKLKDFVDIGTANAILKWRRQVYNPQTGSIGLASVYKKNASLTMFAPNGSVTRIYKLIGCWPKAFDHGDFNMSESGLVFISTTIRFDRAVPDAGLNIGLSGLNAGVLTPAL